MEQEMSLEELTGKSPAQSCRTKLQHQALWGVKAFLMYFFNASLSKPYSFHFFWMVFAKSRFTGSPGKWGNLVKYLQFKLTFLGGSSFSVPGQLIGPCQWKVSGKNLLRTSSSVPPQGSLPKGQATSFRRVWPIPVPFRLFSSLDLRTSCLGSSGGGDD